IGSMRPSAFFYFCNCQTSVQMNLLNHDFFVFYDPDLGATNVVYRRKDGKYGLLSPELK
uniref:sigma 54 modulation/S30EA ribosomal C-terminal domain-containing protein n=1 Tax=Phascolarctobacterium succinatutens TaxID=626940 RepID=UPI003C6DE50C